MLYRFKVIHTCLGDYFIILDLLCLQDTCCGLNRCGEGRYLLKYSIAITCTDKMKINK